MGTPSTCPQLAGRRGHAPVAPARLSAASCLAELLPKFLDQAKKKTTRLCLILEVS